MFTDEHGFYELFAVNCLLVEPMFTIWHESHCPVVSSTFPWPTCGGLVRFDEVRENDNYRVGWVQHTSQSHLTCQVHQLHRRRCGAIPGFREASRVSWPVEARGCMSWMAIGCLGFIATMIHNTFHHALLGKSYNIGSISPTTHTSSFP